MYIKVIVLLAHMTSFSIQKNFIISYITSIKEPTDIEKTKPANKKGKKPANGEETRPTNTERLVDAETLADIKDLVVISYINQY